MHQRHCTTDRYKGAAVDSSHMSSQRILLNPSAFENHHLPATLVARESVLDRLRQDLSPLLKRLPARHIWMHGPPGTAKTSIASHALAELEDRSRVRGLYVNCWECDTFFAILDKIIADLRILGAERFNTVHRLEKIEKFLHGRPFLLILDEIDRPSPRERDAILYHLCAIPNITLICICNSRYFFHTLDRRAASRLDPVLVELQPYTEEQTASILRERAANSLRHSSYGTGLLGRIARLSRGDARVAIQTLKYAATYSENAGRIEPRHVRTALATAHDLKRHYLLEKLSDHHRLIHSIIKESHQIASGELWTEYRTQCRRAKLQHVAARTFSLYVKQLDERQLIVSRRALGVRGNVRLFGLRSG